MRPPNCSLKRGMILDSQSAQNERLRGRASPQEVGIEERGGDETRSACCHEWSEGSSARERLDSSPRPE
jgi:hypothetical protein